MNAQAKAAGPIARQDAPFSGPERPMLQGWLDWHRQTLLSKCSGLTTAQLKHTAVKPSGLSLLGLLRHLSEVERTWFRRRAAGETIPDLYRDQNAPERDLDPAAVMRADAATVLATYRAEVEHSRKAVASLPLDHEFTAPGLPVISLRWVFLHTIEEYARHNGHADLLRERIDGQTGR